MVSRKIKTEIIPYPKHWFLVLAVIFESVIIYWLALAILDENTVMRELWLALCPVVGTLLFLFLVPPLFTDHLAGERALRLRMGLLINQSIPYEWVREVKETSVNRGGLRVGIGVRYFPISRLLFVTSGFTSVAVLKLDCEHELGGIRRRQVDDIVLSVSNLPRFIEIMRSRMVVKESA